MDANGTRFHLINGRDDWEGCREERGPGAPARVAYDPEREALTLRPLLTLYRPDQPGLPLTADARRGAGIDRFGNRYWIGADRRSIVWGDPRGGPPAIYWAWSPPACAPPEATFAPIAPPDADEFPDLAGLAVTAHHYLVVGDRRRRGLYLFDLHAGPDPFLITMPAGIAFEPFDIAPAPGGGCWVLDRRNRAYWGFDRAFRAVGEAASFQTIDEAEIFTFRPVGGAAVVKPARRFPGGFPLSAGCPLAIEALPDGSVLVLDEPAPGDTASRLYRCRLSAQLAGPVELSDTLAIDLGSGSVVGAISISAHDIAFLPGDPAKGQLYAVEDDGKQVIAFDLDLAGDGLGLTARADYLPLHAHGGRAIVADLHGPATQAIYDLVAGSDPGDDRAVRWVAVQPIDQPRYDREASLLITLPGGDPADEPALDGKERGCVWHRLFLDGCLPAETSVEIASRAADRREDLVGVPFQTEPAPYLRAGGPELPYYQAFADGGNTATGRGTWETLFQAARGRFIQLRLVLRGNGRVTPSLNALRVYYPRFSYVRRYLPAAYLDDPTSADFSERFLANQEGFFSELEGKIALAGSLFDPRSAPGEALDWLAGWWGLLLDPLWAEIQQRRARGDLARPVAANRPAGDLPDRRRLLIRFARKLYERRGTADGIRFALMLLLDPCLERLLRRLKAAALTLDRSLRDELLAAGLPYPTPTTSELEFEDLLYDYLLTPGRPSKIRIVERYQTRGGRARALGDPSGDADESVAATAHRFSVLVPEGLDPAVLAMVSRVVRLEQPAHTSFDVRRYFDFFRVGEARLGLESALGDEGRFVMIVLDRNYLAEGYLTPAAPQDAPDRLIAGRDRAGLLPPL